jgi:hypothetical protein
MVAMTNPRAGMLTISIRKMTHSQTNFRIGYFINDHYSIALGVDHMKYVMAKIK